LNKAGVPEKPQNSSNVSGDDIPVAVRDTADAAPQERWQHQTLLIGVVAGLVVPAILGSWFYFAARKETINPQPIPTPTTQPNNPHSTQSNSNNDTVLGHFPYKEAPESELVPISLDRRIRMRKAAAQKFMEMAQAAWGAGIILVPISGFRSVKEQEQLFFTIGALRNQTPAQRAALSAPPGHSEHHTGYAVDIGDGAVPATNLEPSFDKTRAYQWLQANAARFSFEMSFPKNNIQGVSYEPWHWRFVGDRDSLETFYRARNFKPVH